MKVFALLLKGYTDVQHFEGDTWTAKDGIVTINRYGGGPVAAFPFESLIGIIDLTEGPQISQDQVADRLRESKNAPAKARKTRPGDDVTAG